MNITPPLSEKVIRALHAGDQVTISGSLYTARDAAHKRLVELIEQGKDLPFDLRGRILYYVGPTPPRPGRVIGSAGPTTASRMDRYAPVLIEKAGLAGMIGKAGRGENVVEAMKRFGAVYFAAIGGAGALLSSHIIQSEIVCYEELGTEAVRRLTVENFPVITAIDSHGNSLYREGPERWGSRNSTK